LHEYTYYVYFVRMSKPSSLRLTGSPKTRRRPRRKSRRQDNADWTGTLDALHDRCRNIEVLAGLIEVCNPDETRHEVICGAGYLLSDEASKLRELIEAMEQKGAKP
jgi:hypothetical protein